MKSSHIRKVCERKDHSHMGQTNSKLLMIVLQQKGQKLSKPRIKIQQRLTYTKILTLRYSNLNDAIGVIISNRICVVKDQKIKRSKVIQKMSCLKKYCIFLIIYIIAPHTDKAYD